MTPVTDEMKRPSASPGVLLHAALAYDALVWLASLGRDRALREAMLHPAGLLAGEAVLDAGCGTGSLALAARRRVGPAGRVCGIDAAPEMLARARRKAARAGLEVEFREGAAQALPFPDASFDVVLSTLMLHHLPGQARVAFAGEIRRVLKPGGRVLAIDFVATQRRRNSLLPRLHQHGHVRLDETAAMLEAAGLRCIEAGPLGFRGAIGLSDLHYVLAAPEAAG